MKQERLFVYYEETNPRYAVSVALRKNKVPYSEMRRREKKKNLEEMKRSRLALLKNRHAIWKLTSKLELDIPELEEAA